MAAMPSTDRSEPNVTTEGGGGRRRRPQGGARYAGLILRRRATIEFNRYSLDGIENTDLNFNSYIINPSVDALAGVQSSNRRLLGGVRSRHVADQRHNEIRRQPVPWHGLRVSRNSALDAREWRQSDGNKTRFAAINMVYFRRPDRAEQALLPSKFRSRRADRKTLQRERR